MTIGSRAQGRRRAATALATALLCTLGSVGAGAQEATPPGGGGAKRSGYASDVVVAEAYRLYPGGRALPVEGDAEALVEGDVEALVSRLNAAQTAARDLGLTLAPGLEVGTGHTARLFEAPPALRADGEPAAPLAARFVTLRPVAYRGVPLAPGSDILSVATVAGTILAVRERNLPREVDGTTPTVDASAAKRAALEAGRAHGVPADAVAEEPVLEVFVDRSTRGRLAWRVRVASASLTAAWAREIWLAAIGKPEVLADREGIYHTHNGHASATAWSDSPFGAFPVHDLAEATVRRSGSGGGTTTTGPDGRYAFGFGLTNATLRVGVAGLNSTVNNVPGAEVVGTGSGSPPVPVDLFINAGTDLELAQTSAFVWVNRANTLTDGFRPASALARLRTNVNIAQSCNAFWNGSSINFYQAGRGCPNTAYSDIVLHEYGHGVDESLGGIIDGGYSEGAGDALALLGTRQPCVGRDFSGAGSCLRDATTSCCGRPPRARGSLHRPPLLGLRVGPGHGAAAHLQPRRRLRDRPAARAGRRRRQPLDVPDAVQLSFLVDDDDGQLSNGTPHCAELAAAADSRIIPHPPGRARRTVADLNNDGRADIVGFGDAGVWTALSAGDGTFAPRSSSWPTSAPIRGGARGARAHHGRPQQRRPGGHRGLRRRGRVDRPLGGRRHLPPEHFVLANFGVLQGWDPLQHVRTLADVNGDGRADIVAFGFHGVWTALSAGDGTFAPQRFVLANFGFNQAWSRIDPRPRHGRPQQRPAGGHRGLRQRRRLDRPVGGGRQLRAGAVRARQLRRQPGLDHRGPRADRGRRQR